jgi:stearoyl-CoA desaturase (delta-9 desaturase)
MWNNGLLDLSVWQLVAVTLAMTHVTIVSVTVYLHRYSAHRPREALAKSKSARLLKVNASDLERVRNKLVA